MKKGEEEKEDEVLIIQQKRRYLVVSEFKYVCRRTFPELIYSGNVLRLISQKL